MKTRPSYFSDYLIALVVILCTLVLLGALAMTLTGFRLTKPGRTLQLDFPDVAGIHQHSQVRYAGAPAGSVIAIETSHSGGTAHQSESRERRACHRGPGRSRARAPG